MVGGWWGWIIVVYRTGFAASLISGNFIGSDRQCWLDDAFGVSLQFFYALPSLLSCITTLSQAKSREHLPA